MTCFHFDSKNDPHEAMKIASGRMRLVGNVNCPITMFSKGPEEVNDEVTRCLDAGVDLIAPECALPLQTKLENILEIPKAVKKWSEANPSSIYATGRNSQS